MQVYPAIALTPPDRWIVLSNAGSEVVKHLPQRQRGALLTASESAWELVVTHSLTSFSMTVVSSWRCSSMTLPMLRMERMRSRSGFTCRAATPAVSSAGIDCSSVLPTRDT